MQSGNESHVTTLRRHFPAGFAFAATFEWRRQNKIYSVPRMSAATVQAAASSIGSPASDPIAEWDAHGIKDEFITTIREWCLKRHPSTFVVFSFGTVVHVTREMAERETKAESLKLPAYPTTRVNDEDGSFAANRVKYVAAKSASLDEASRIIYRAAVGQLAEDGYPVPGLSDSDGLIRHLDGDMWTHQYARHARSISHLPGTLGVKNGQGVSTAVKHEIGPRMDMLMLVPAFIHAPKDNYDTANRSLDPKIWDNMSQKGLYDNPDTVGLRVFSTSPNISQVLGGMLR